MTMSEDIRKEWRRAMWTIVTAAVLALGGSFAQSVIMQQSMVEQLKILQKEQEIIRQKLDVIQIQLQNKVDRTTLDNFLNRIDDKLDKISDNIFKIKQNTNP